VWGQCPHAGVPPLHPRPNFREYGCMNKASKQDRGAEPSVFRYEKPRVQHLCPVSSSEAYMGHTEPGLGVELSSDANASTTVLTCVSPKPG